MTTPAQWWEIYGPDDASADAWGTATLAVVDEIWSSELADIVCPQSLITCGGWDIGAAVVGEILSIDWADADAASITADIIGSVCGAVISGIVQQVPILGIVASLMTEIFGSAQAAAHAAQLQAIADRQAKVRARTERGIDAHKLIGSGPGGQIEPSDWFVQAVWDDDERRMVPTGRRPWIGSHLEAALATWPKKHVAEEISRLGPNGEFEGLVPYAKAANWPAVSRGLAHWFGVRSAKEYGVWLTHRGELQRAHNVPTAIGRYDWAGQWPDFGSLHGPIWSLHRAIADQAPALHAPDAWVDGGRSLAPLLMDLWCDLAFRPVEHFPGGEPRPRLPMELLATLHSSTPYDAYLQTRMHTAKLHGLDRLYHIGSWDRFDGHAIIQQHHSQRPLPWIACQPTPYPRAFPPYDVDPFIGYRQVARMLQTWQQTVYPALAPDRAEAQAQIRKAYDLIEAGTIERLTPHLRSIASTAARLTRGARAKATTDGMRELGAGLGIIDRDAIDRAADDARAAARSRRIYAFAPLAAAGVVGALALTSTKSR